MTMQEMKETRRSKQLDYSDSVASPGARLQLAREIAKISITDLATTIRLNPRLIVAIEQDDYTSMPGLTFVRGYLRAYANVVGVSADEIIHSFNQLGLKELRPLLPPEQIRHIDMGASG